MWFSRVLLSASALAWGVAHGGDVTIRFEDSQGNGFAGELVKVYKGGWKNFCTTDAQGECTASVDNGNRPFRVTRDSITQELSLSVESGTNELVFKTVDFKVLLLDSNAGPLDGGLVKYYSGGWRTFGTTDGSGVASKEILPHASLTFSMTRDSLSRSKAAAVSPAEDNVVFQTVNMKVRLMDSTGSNGLESATVKYYAGGWRTFGATDSSGWATKELLSQSDVDFSIAYNYISKTYKADVSPMALVVKTVSFQVNVLEADGLTHHAEPMTFKFYAGGWRTFGTSSTGYLAQEMLPSSAIPFSVTLDSITNTIEAEISEESTSVDFHVHKVQILFADSTKLNRQNSGVVKYYAGGWRTFGNVGANGLAERYMLSTSGLQISLTDDSLTQTIVNDIPNVDSNGDAIPILFSTIEMKVVMTDSTGNPFPTDGAVVKYYAGGWRTFGTIVGGQAIREMLPQANQYQFSLTSDSLTLNKFANIAAGSIVEFQTVLFTMKLMKCDESGSAVPDVSFKYYAGGWRTFGESSDGDDGIVSMELLPMSNDVTVSVQHASVTVQKATPIYQGEFKFESVRIVSDTYLKYYAGGWRTFTSGMYFPSGVPSLNFKTTSGDESVNIESDRCDEDVSE